MGRRYAWYARSEYAAKRKKALLSILALRLAICGILLYIMRMSKAVVIRYKPSRPGGAVDKAACAAMLKRAFNALSKGEAPDTNAFLRSLFGGGVVGMKTNCLARQIATTKALVSALGDALTATAGVRDNDIIIWERTNAELMQAGYTLNASSSGRRCFGTDSNGVGYNERFFKAGKVQTLISNVVTSMIDHSINVPVLKDHSIAGMSGGLKNMFGAIRNPNKYHMNNCDPYVADVNSLKPIRKKHRLTLIDAFKVQYDKGPGFNPACNLAYGGIIVSCDPVAADAVAFELLERIRKAKGLAPLSDVGRPVKYLASAKKAGLGENELKNIDVQVIGLNADGRISAGGLF
jgi:uncharacterized protein (DUF362 family)